MSITPALLAILACPSDDHAPLRLRVDGGVATLVCTYCATSFPIRDDIPVLLLDDATPGPNGIGVAAPPPPPEPTPEPARPVTVESIIDPRLVSFDPSPSPRHLRPDDADDEPGTAPADGPVAPPPGAATPPPGSANPAGAATPAGSATTSGAATPSAPDARAGGRAFDGLRGRVQQRLAELEATRGPRPRRRGGR